MKQLNMTKAYRAELRDLRRHRRKVESDLRKTYQQIQRHREKVIKETIRILARADKGAQKSITAIDRRIGILEGRIS